MSEVATFKIVVTCPVKLADPDTHGDLFDEQQEAIDDAIKAGLAAAQNRLNEQSGGLGRLFPSRVKIDIDE